MTGGFAGLEAALPAYEFDAPLGRGAWGVVVAARHRRLERDVAVKWLAPELMSDPNARRRFAGEARLLASLDHPHIVRIHDYVEAGDICALVMERLRGGSLADRVRLGGVDHRVACAIGLAGLHGLEHAHQNNVLHRDIKPENLLFTRDGLLKVTDFGIATVIGDRAVRMTATGVALGTPAYMAPEQLDATQEPTAATDVWGAGAVIYELLAGETPYPTAPSLSAALLARATDSPRPLTDVAPDVPQPIAAAVMRALARLPADRHPGTAEFAADLDRAARDEWGADWLDTTAVPVHRTPVRLTAATTGAIVAPAAQPTTDRRPGRLAVAVVTALVAVVAVVLLLVGGGGGARAPSGLPPLPVGWPSRLTVGVEVPADQRPGAAGHFGAGVQVPVTLGGDPLAGDSWSHSGGSRPAYDAVTNVQAAGGAPFVYYYALRLLGRGRVELNAAPLAAMRDRRLMAAYWRDVSKLLTQLGAVGRPIPLVIEPSFLGLVEATTNSADPSSTPTAVAATGNADLRGLPDSFAGWAQAWVRLRNRYAPRVMLGLQLDAYGPGDQMLPARPSGPTVDAWAGTFGRFYAGLGARADFISYVTAYGEAGRRGPKYIATSDDFERVRRFLAGVVRATHLRVVLDSVPVGNTLMRAMNNTPYHWRDTWAQWLLGDTRHLRSFRDAGVAGVVFTAGIDPPNSTCPCDAAQDGITNPPGLDGTERPSLSADDDGGYLAEHVRRYLGGSRLAL